MDGAASAIFGNCQSKQAAYGNCLTFQPTPMLNVSYRSISLAALLLFLVSGGSDPCEQVSLSSQESASFTVSRPPSSTPRIPLPVLPVDQIQEGESIWKAVSDGPLSGSVLLESRSSLENQMEEWWFLADSPVFGEVAIIARPGDKGRWYRHAAFKVGEYLLDRSAFPDELPGSMAAEFGRPVAMERQNDLVALLSMPVQGLEEVMELERHIHTGHLQGKMEPNHLVFPAASPDDPDFASSWTLQLIEMEPVWARFGFSPEARLGRRPVVAVVDNGAPSGHRDLHMWINVDEIPDNGIDDDGNNLIDDVSGFNFARFNADISFAGSHGSKIAEIAASLTNNETGTASPASSASLMRVLYFLENGGNHFAAIDGMLYSIDNGADVVNCSFVSSSAFMFQPVFEHARGRNVIVVAAAGNGGNNLDERAVYPAYLEAPNFLTVGASNEADLRGNSHFSPTRVDLFAPGGATSFSTPLVVSTVALLRALAPDASYAEIRSAIMEGVDLVPELEGLCLSGGRLNVRGAVEALLNIDLSDAPSPVVPPSAPGLRIGEIGETSMVLEWNLPEAVEGFEIEYRERAAGFVPLEPSAVFGGEETGVLVEGLSPGTEYQWRIRSIRGALTSDWLESEWIRTLEVPEEPPPAPALTVAEVRETAILLEWNPPEAVEGFEIAYRERAAGFVPLEPSAVFGGEETGVLVEGLSPGIEYQWRIRSIQGALTSDWVESAWIRTPDPIPELLPLPVAEFIEIGAFSVGLSWSTAVESGDLEVEIRENTGPYVALDLGEPLQAHSGNLVIEDLSPSTQYTIRLRVVDSGHASEWSESGPLTTLALPPEAPPPPVFSVESPAVESAVLSWEMLQEVERFEAEWVPDGGDWNAAQGFAFSPDDRNQLILGGLSGGTFYRFRMRSVHQGLFSGWAETDPVWVHPEPWISGLLEPIEVPEPVHYWDFSGAGLERSLGKGSVPLHLPVPPAFWGEGLSRSGTGLALQGEHRGIRFPAAPSLDEGLHAAYTVAFWVNPDPESAGWTSVLYEQGGFWRGLNLILDRQWLVASGWNRPSEESGWTGTTLYGGRLTPATWYHVALVLEAGVSVEDNGLRLYLNGQPVDAGPASQLWPQADKSGLGQVQGSTVFRERQLLELHPFQGSFDEVAIWNRALSEAVIAELVRVTEPAD